MAMGKTLRLGCGGDLCEKNMTLDRMLLLHPQSFLKVKEVCISLW